MKKLPQAKKHLGQHFLQDQKVIQNITQDWKDEADVIVEVGPGPAVLTRHLAEHGKPLFVIEKDEEMVNYIQDFVTPENIFIQDGLEFDWEKFILDKKLQDKKIWLVSNLPYNVGTILYTQFLQIPQIHYMTLMFQKEVGDKTYLKQQTNQMNGLLFLSLNYFNPRKLCKVLPGAFNPPPKVDSVVVSYERKSPTEVQFKNFDELNKFCRVLFSQKRKQIGKVLKQAYSSAQIADAAQKVDIPLTLRAENLSFQQVSDLFSHLK